MTRLNLIFEPSLAAGKNPRIATDTSTMRSNGGCAETNLKQLDRARFGLDACGTSRSRGISDRIILDSRTREPSSEAEVGTYVGPLRTVNDTYRRRVCSLTIGTA